MRLMQQVELAAAQHILKLLFERENRLKLRLRLLSVKVCEELDLPRHDKIISTIFCTRGAHHQEKVNRLLV
jgi:hypothetical protein